MKTNLILCSDSYKFSHYNMFPDHTEATFYYVEPRGGSYDEIVPFGLQYYLKEYLTKPIEQSDINEAKTICQLHGIPFNQEGWQHILTTHNGYLPLRIRAVPEGLPIPVKNVIMTVETTDPKCYWLAGFMETLLLKVWYPITVASRSRYIKKSLLAALEKSSDNPKQIIDFMLHSFGYRGVSSEESAGIGGAAELIHFKGSDTMSGILLARDYYHCEMAGFSVPATEHSVITSFGKDNELEAYRHLLATYAKKNAIVACVSDSYDLWNCIEKFWCGELKEMIINSGATFVCRLDSGDPIEIVPRALQMLDQGFGHTINSKGYKILKNVKVLQGDGINEKSITEILNVVLSNGYSAENLVFGCGAGMIQKLDRDTSQFAYKLSSIKINGQWQDAFKEPKTDLEKKSKAGRLDLIQLGIQDDFAFRSVKIDDRIACNNSIMRTVFENGKLLIDDNFETIRERAKL